MAGISDPVSDCADHTTAEATRTRGDGSIELPTDIEPEYDFPDNTGTSNRRQLDVVIGLYGVYVGKRSWRRYIRRHIYVSQRVGV